MPATSFHALPADASVSETLALTSVVRASEEEGEAPINPWFVGAAVLLMLLLLLGAVMAFGGGRDHS